MSNNNDVKQAIETGVRGVIYRFKTEVIESGDYGNLSFWMALLRKIMQFIQTSIKLKGLDKMEIALSSIKELASTLLETNPADIDEQTKKTLNAVLSDEGLGLLGAATGVFKDFMRKIDTDGDGEISAQECRDLFSCCFPNKQSSK